jgi:hypothetical protein
MQIGSPLGKTPRNMHSMMKQLQEKGQKAKRTLYGAGSGLVGIPPIKTQLDITYQINPDGGMQLRGLDKEKKSRHTSSLHVI